MRYLKSILTLVVSLLINNIFTQTFNYSGAIETYTVPAGITILKITTVGAAGGEGINASSGTPGKGASMEGEFEVTPGQILSILVGEKGEDGADFVGGGGGGSFVWDQTTEELLIAAGGGGGGGSTDGAVDFVDGINASISESGTNGAGFSDGGGSSGNGGVTPTSAQNWASGGAGWNSVGNNGSDHGCSNSSTSGTTPLLGGAGGTGGGGPSAISAGGFGGGGGSNGRCGAVGGGGGGGYSGGGAGGELILGDFNGGGGGGSFNAGHSQNNNAGVGVGNGQVIIEEVLCIPLNVFVSDTILCTGEQLTLNATSSFGTVFNWDGGALNNTAFSPSLGVTTYTVNSNHYKDCSYSVDVQMVENISVEDTVIFGANNTSMINITVTGAGTYEFDWSTDEAGDFDDTEDVNNLPPGNYSVVVRNEFGCSVSKIYTISGIIGIELLDNAKISIYPNPVNDVLNINFPFEYKYEIINLSGKIVLSKKSKGNSTISVDHLTKGFYYVNVKTKNDNFKRIFLKK